MVVKSLYHEKKLEQTPEGQTLREENTTARSKSQTNRVYEGGGS